MVISLFIACYNDTLFPDTGKAVVAVLERLGHSVEFRAGQTCCGQMHYNTGYRPDSIALMKHFLDVYRDAETICIPSSSCVAMIRDHYPKMAAELDNPDVTAEVDAVLGKTFEFSELLIDKLGVEDVHAVYPHTVTYHPSCHSLRSLHLGDKPLRLLQKVGDIDLVELPACDECCGFGGTFAVKNPDVSAAMLAEKTAAVLATGAKVCCAVDNSCLMHIFGGLHRQRAGVTTMHLAEILAHTEANNAAASRRDLAK